MAFIGVISDTHGLVRPEALEALQGAEALLLPGDIGKPEVLDTLREVAPVHAIRGNIDVGRWADAIPFDQTVELHEHRVHLIHDISTLRIDPKREGIDVVVYGHSHKPSIHRDDGVLYLNPGSAGPRRFRLPIAVARLWLDGAPKAEVVELERISKTPTSR